MSAISHSNFPRTFVTQNRALRKSDLIFHYRLLKPRPTHCPLPGLLAPTPRLSSIGRLRYSLPFAIFRHFLQWSLFITKTLGRYRHCIRVRYVLYRLWRVRIVGRKAIRGPVASGVGTMSNNEGPERKGNLRHRSTDMREHGDEP